MSTAAPILICGDHWSADLVVSLARAHLRHGFFQHLLIKLDADFAHMAGLLFAQKIARAADVEVVAGDREARAQLIERLQHLQPPLRRLGQLPVGGRRQIGVSALLGAADAAAQLIKLRQAEHVGAMHDQRVGGRECRGRFPRYWWRPARRSCGRRTPSSRLPARVAAIWPCADGGFHFRHGRLQELLAPRADRRCAGTT